MISRPLFRSDEAQNSESDLIDQITSAHVISDVEKILAKINDHISLASTLEQKQSLKRCRQRAYDRRRKLQNFAEEQASMPAQNNLFEFPPVAELQRSQNDLMNEMKNLSAQVDLLTEEFSSARALPLTETSKPDFLSGVFSQISKIRGDVFIRNFPLALICGSLAFITAWFVADQITPLYQAFNFEKASYVAWGSIGMAAGFSAIYGALNSRVSAFMCALVVFYEILFVCAGTRSHEARLQSFEAANSAEVIFAKAGLDKAKADYGLKKARYENKDDKMFQNNWFKTSYLDPAWADYSKKLSAYTGLTQKYTEENGGFGLPEFLKLFFRVCSVIFLMTLTGLTVRKLRDSIAFQT